jgi:hypothetical protein
VHHPVRDRQGHTITTAVTNLDVHDIARSTKTFGIAAYYIVTPVEAQRELVGRILEHWRSGAGARRVPERGRALALCRVVADLDAARADFAASFGVPPHVLVTEARREMAGEILDYREARTVIEERATMLLFGTGHGLATEVIRAADGVIAPIRSASDYNHLSVRAAVAITLDRLIGD